MTESWPDLEFLQRPLTHPDVQLLVAQVQDFYARLYGGGGDQAPMDAAEFEPPAGSFFVGYLAGEPVATAAWRRREVAGLVGPTAELKRMYVRGDLQGRGYGRRALSFIEDDARRAGIADVVLETGVKQVAAVGLYERHGYVPLPDGVDDSWDVYRCHPTSRRYWRRLA